MLGHPRRDFAQRLACLGGDHVHAVHHDPAHRALLERERAQEHVGLLLLQRPGLGAERDRRAQLAEAEGAGRLAARADGADGHASHQVERGHRRSHHGGPDRQRGGVEARQRPVVMQRDRLWPDLAEDDEQHGNHQRGGQRRLPPRDQLGGDDGAHRRRPRVYEVVAQQDRREQPPRAREQAGDAGGAGPALADIVLEAHPLQREEGRLRAGEEPRTAPAARAAATGR